MALSQSTSTTRVVKMRHCQRHPLTGHCTGTRKVPDSGICRDTCPQCGGGLGEPVITLVNVSF